MNQTLFVLMLTIMITLFCSQQSVYGQAIDAQNNKMLSIGVRINNATIDGIHTAFSFPLTFFWWKDSIPETNDLSGKGIFWLSNPFVQISPAFGTNGNSVQGRLGCIVYGNRGLPRESWQPTVYAYLWGDINYMKIKSDKSYLFPGIGIGGRTSDWALLPRMVLRTKNLWLDFYVGYLIANNEFSTKHTKSKNWTFGISVDYTFRW